MKRVLLLAGIFALASSFALAAGYDKTETTKAYTIRLRVPDAALSNPALKAEIITRWKKDSGEIKSEATEDLKDQVPDFHPYMLDTQWRVTFENADVISLSANSFIDQNGAHPNGSFDSIVWDKKANRVVPFEDLFVPTMRKTAFNAIAASARKSWIAIMTKREGDAPIPGMVDDGIGADAKKLGHYALIYDKGASQPNGIVLLYGSGEVWPNAAGDFRLVVPTFVFRAYLTPEWKARFS
ncbi:MAG TPA: DUF4163 domain-containing protein [Rhizomicrobium sp.]|jgi:hypothetical protein